ncbi:hypothetical protein, partial [Kitasatospora cineracea]|uniref:hypothetical protein n=1 Tax=Kitasatospora cineracea TaxID=88074 RepID=UPI0033DF9A73
ISSAGSTNTAVARTPHAANPARSGDLARSSVAHVTKWLRERPWSRTLVSVGWRTHRPTRLTPFHT